MCYICYWDCHSSIHKKERKKDRKVGQNKEQKKLRKKEERKNRSIKKQEQSLVCQKQQKLKLAVKWLHPIFMWCFQSPSVVTPPAFNAGLAQGCFPFSSFFLVILLLHLFFLEGRRRTHAYVIRLRSPRQVPFLPFSKSDQIHTDSIPSHLWDISHVWKSFFFFSKAEKHFNCNNFVSISALS